MKLYQFTMWSDKGYKPVSCSIEANSRLDFAGHTKYTKKAIAQICNQRSWTKNDMLKFGYKTYKVRVAPPQKVKPVGTI